MIHDVFCVEFGLECLATWTEDSHSYFYARLPGVGDEEYRCFVSTNHLVTNNKLVSHTHNARLICLM